MVNFLIKRLINGFVILLGVVTVIFLLFNTGRSAEKSIRMQLGQRSDEASYNAMKREMGLDRSVFKRYVKYLNDLSFISVHTKDPDSFFYFNKDNYGNPVKLFSIGKTSLIVLKFPYLRRSYQSKKLVSPMIRDAMVNTFILALIAIIIAAITGILFGIVAALKKDHFIDRMLLFLSALGMSVPSFFAAIIIGWVFAFLLGHVTGLNLTGNIIEIDDFGDGEYIALKNLILPAFTLAIRPLSVFLQLTRNSVLDILTQDYVRTAYAKGLTKYQVIKNHVLRNALNPVLTSISGWFASLMAGVVFIEYIFGWKGLGYLVVDALNKEDIPLIMGCVLTIATVFVVINILVDIVYSMLDPRVRLA